jgi:inhibitor of cysteine peptidase
MKRRGLTYILTLLLSLSLFLSLLTACGNIQPGSEHNPGASPSPNVTGNKRSAQPAGSYSEVFKAISNAENTPLYAGGAVRGSTPAAAPAEDSIDKTQYTSVQSEGASDAGFSTTNVQVTGVDEGDIVKTDGKYIYVLHANELIIFKADGAGTRKLSTVTVCGAPDNAKEPDRYENESATELYVSGDTVAVISTYYAAIPYPIAEGDYSEKIMAPQENNITKLRVYNVSDRSAPVLVSELGQDGYMTASRVIGNSLYLLSSYYVYNADEGDTGTYIPRLYCDGVSALVAEDSISIMPYYSSTAYTVICAYNLERAAMTSNQTLLGGGSTVYSDSDTLYVASSSYDQTESAPYSDSVYTVIDYTSQSVTDITSFNITDGKISLASSGTVPGYLIDQFAMDEYSGNLRVVTTTNKQSWSEYTDKAKGWTNYVYDESSTDNALFVLDGSLNIIGSVGDLAKDESVYSVRFDGAIGYFVTFRRTDPLFAVDLNDPAKPTVLSALKIPGFSEYLHVYADGRLFGLGMDADEETGQTKGMKLSMFDTSNPTDVTEKNTLLIGSGYSAALYNHKAILISAEKDIIAFPYDSGYVIYGYSDEQGFYKRGEVTSVEWTGDARGLYIGDYAYIIDYGSVTVVDMASFGAVTKITF